MWVCGLRGPMGAWVEWVKFLRGLRGSNVFLRGLRGSNLFILIVYFFACVSFYLLDEVIY